MKYRNKIENAMPNNEKLKSDKCKLRLYSKSDAECAMYSGTNNGFEHET